MSVELNPFSDVPFHYSESYDLIKKGWFIFELFGASPEDIKIMSELYWIRELMLLPSDPPKKQSTLCYKVVRREDDKLISCIAYGIDGFTKEYIPGEETLPNANTYLFVFSDKKTAVAFSNGDHEFEVWKCEAELVDDVAVRPSINLEPRSMESFWDTYHAEDRFITKDAIFSQKLDTYIGLDGVKVHNNFTRDTRFAKSVKLLERVQHYNGELPKYEHDCSRCTFLGSFHDIEMNEVVDLYHCESFGNPTVIARFGLDGAYYSGMCFADGTIPALTEAKRRAEALGLCCTRYERESCDTENEKKEVS